MTVSLNEKAANMLLFKPISRQTGWVFFYLNQEEAPILIPHESDSIKCKSNKYRLSSEVFKNLSNGLKNHFHNL